MNSKHKCPRCNVALEKDEVKDMYFNTVEIESCPSCEGQWIPDEQLDFLAKEYEVVLLEFKKIPKLKEQLKQLHCPRCKSHPIMEKVEHPRDAKVILDTCPNCNGVWLDKGELAAIQQEDLFGLAAKLYRWTLSRE